jgi:hypothetical protein
VFHLTLARRGDRLEVLTCGLFFGLSLYCWVYSIEEQKARLIAPSTRTLQRDLWIDTEGKQLLSSAESILESPPTGTVCTPCTNFGARGHAGTHMDGKNRI